MRNRQVRVTVSRGFTRRRRWPIRRKTAAFVRAYRAFLDELHQLGHVEGTNLIVERYSGGGLLDRYEELVRNVVLSRHGCYLRQRL